MMKYSSGYKLTVYFAALPTRLSGRARSRPRSALALRHVPPRPLDNLLEVQRLLRRAAPDYEHNLAAYSSREVLRRFLGPPPQDLLVQLRELPAYCYRRLRGQFLERPQQPVRRLEEYEGG